MARAGSLTLASAFILTLGATACSHPRPAPTQNTATAATPTPLPERSPAPTSGTAALSTTELKSRLLTVTDLPSGFAPDPEDTTADGHISARDAHCQPMADLMNTDGKPPGATASAEASFTRSELGPNVATGLASFPTAQAAQALLDTVTTSTRTCTTLTETDKDGTSYDFTVAPLTFPTIGDADTAIRLSADIGGYPAQVDIVLSRVGSTLLYVANTGLGDRDAELTREVVSRAVAKVEEPGEPVAEG